MPFAQLKLLPKKERSIVNRHPWIFSGAVNKAENIDDGAIVEVINNEYNVLGYGFFSQKSQIVCRMFHWDKIPGDFNDSDYWKNKIWNALEVRKLSILQHSTDAYRLIHAEGDFLPGLIIDIYKDIAVLQILILGIEKIKPLLILALNDLGFKNLYVKSKVSSHILEEVDNASEWISGHQKTPVEITENNLKFEVDFVKGQKTGFFIDQRENRALLTQYCKDKTVLNAFSYTGGFSIYALQGDAQAVYSLDISKEAILVAEKNAAINHLDSKHFSIIQDCFDYLKEMSSNFFDIIVLDPPAFAKSSRAVVNAARGYKQINMRAIQKIKPGGLIFTFSCSQNISKDLFQKIIFGAAADARRNVRILHQLHQPSDHPINIYHPEGEYLKGLVLYVE